MKQIDISLHEIVRPGIEFHTNANTNSLKKKKEKSVSVDELLPHMERNEAYVYWLQPIGGKVEEQTASVLVDGVFYCLNSKLEKAIFRNVRLTRDFKNFERLLNGVGKLIIPTRLFNEKIRSSKRVTFLLCSICQNLKVVYCKNLKSKV